MRVYFRRQTYILCKRPVKQNEEHEYKHKTINDSRESINWTCHSMISHCAHKITETHTHTRRYKHRFDEGFALDHTQFFCAHVKTNPPNHFFYLLCVSLVLLSEWNWSLYISFSHKPATKIILWLLLLLPLLLVIFNAILFSLLQIHLYSIYWLHNRNNRVNSPAPSLSKFYNKQHTFEYLFISFYKLIRM